MKQTSVRVQALSWGLRIGVQTQEVVEPRTLNLLSFHIEKKRLTSRTSPLQCRWSSSGSDPFLIS